MNAKTSAGLTSLASSLVQLVAYPIVFVVRNDAAGLVVLLAAIGSTCVAIVAGAIGLRRARDRSTKAASIAGLVIGLAGLVVLGVMVASIAGIAMLATSGGD